jgi:ribose transport system permease protein
MSTPTIDTVITPAEPGHSRPAAGRRARKISPYTWVWVGVVLIYAVILVVTPNAGSLSALQATLPYIGLLTIVAAGQTVVILQRGIDFSVVGAIILNAMVVAYLSSAGWDIPAAIAATLVVGLAVGFLNGLIVVRLSLTPLVATLAANGIYIGIALMIGGGFPVKVSEPLIAFARDSVWGVSAIFVIAVALVLVLALVINRTVAGRRFVAAGSNPVSGWAAGIQVQSYTLLAYLAAGLCYSVAGILLASYIGDARMTMGGDYLMASIAAVVIGGTPLTGGRGSLIATLGGAVFMTLLTQFVLAMGAPTSIQLFVQAIVLVTAVTLPNVIGLVRRHRMGGRTR